MICCQCGGAVDKDWMVECRLVPESSAWCMDCKLKMQNYIGNEFYRAFKAMSDRKMVATGTIIIPLQPSPEENYRTNYDRIFGVKKK